jgi:hypothetical protein
MKQRLIYLVFGVLALGAASVANARVDFSVNIGPPPVVYQPYPTYAAPPVVYIGGGNWGRGHHRDNHHDYHRHR